MESARPRRRRVSALLAEKGLNNTPRASANDENAAMPPRTKKSEIQKEPRRRTIYIPSDDTTIMTIHPGAFASGSRNPRAKSPDLGFDLVTVSEEEPGQLKSALKQSQKPRKPLVAAPKRAPLQQSTRPFQAVSFVEDRVGKGVGKENIPPGRSFKAGGKESKKASAQFPEKKDHSKQPTKPDAIRRVRTSATGPTSSSLVKGETTRKRTSSVSLQKETPSKVLKSARYTPTARAPLKEKTPKHLRKPLSSSASSSPFHNSRTPPRALRRQRLEKAPSKLSVPMLAQQAEKQEEKYPVLLEDLQRPELYEDSWLSYQEVAITQLVNNLFHSADPCSIDQEAKEGDLRRQLLAVYQEPAIPLLHKRLQASLLYGALSIPKDLLDKALRLKDDVGQRRKFLDLFVKTYDLSLLKAAAEVVIGRQIPVSSRLSSGSTSSESDSRHKRAERKAIEGFLDIFFIRNEDAVRVKAGIGSIASIARGREQAGDDFGSQGWSWRRTVLRSLMLVLLLDLSKKRDIIPTPLFQTTSNHKSSTSVLQGLASLLLPSLGDLSRPLGHLDYHLHCIQYPLQEYDYHIRNLATDLRDGVLLTRLVELLLYTPATLALQKDNITVTMPTGELLTSSINASDKEAFVLSQHLKYPCIGRAQKTYNIQIALSALEGVKGIASRVAAEVTAEDIVDGHREKTLGLLWGLVGKWGLEALVDWKEVEREIQRHRQQHDADENADPDSDEEADPEELEGLEKHTSLLRRWARGIARGRSLRVANLTTSFADNRVLEAVVDAYIGCIPAVANTDTTTSTLPAKLRSIGCSAAFVSLFAAPTTAHHSKPIPSSDFTTTTLAFLAARLLPASRAHRAATTLQRSYRARLARQHASRRVVLLRLAAHCATVVRAREHVVGAATVLQRAWRRVLDARIERLIGDVLGFQAVARGWAARRRVNGALAAGKKGGAAGRRGGRIRGGW
ncbi:uncharacterized protein K452DRAFT_223122 [Aplosporella prunicola CBS 121167]|uniref:Calponin-homology (CH) domain-containing protein n=1 Tax=Aplosporella prunicola CBS 121167 TaxID=1176127 RepID=A0A6A6BPD2_9PEZI|nr:uncharacterized protein K452DRAFT_223122 [Aplosporella prunicola CBS 121167]KAF2144687.1 hypothetical protein K452DRAFT_223122 [Aplosporella prunicola CBS 121167]